MRRYHMSRINPEVRLITRRMITVKDAASGSRDRSRCNASMTSTSNRQAYDANKGWSGGISVAAPAIVSLHKETSLKHTEHQTSFQTQPINFRS